MIHHRAVAMLGLVLASGSFLISARAATVQTLDPTPISGTLSGIDQGVLTVTRKGAEPVKISMGDILEIGISWEDRQAHAVSTPPAAPPSTAPATQHAATTQKKPLLWHAVFVNGDHLTAALSEWADGQVTCTLDALKGAAVTVPVGALRELWSDASFDALTLVKKAKDLHISSQAQDVAFVQKDGDVKAVAGLVTGMDDTSLHFKFEGEEHTIKLDRIVGVIFAQKDAPAETGLYQTFTLMNSDTLSGRTQGMANGIFQVVPTTGGSGNTARMELPLAMLTKLETRNGRMVYVSDLTPISVSQSPYFERLMPYQVNQSLTGGAMRLNDGTVAKGIAVHSRCVLTYALDRQYERFRAKVGFQQPEGKVGRAAVRVLGDEKVLWEDADLKGDGKPAVLDLPASGVKTLTLEVGYGKDEDIGDRVIWGDARLIKPAGNVPG
jgi:NPCBM/NEW2 domain